MEKPHQSVLGCIWSKKAKTYPYPFNSAFVFKSLFFNFARGRKLWNDLMFCLTPYLSGFLSLFLVLNTTLDLIWLLSQRIMICILCLLFWLVQETLGFYIKCCMHLWCMAIKRVYPKLTLLTSHQVSLILKTTFEAF